jgi:hypothetical protein
MALSAGIAWSLAHAGVAPGIECEYAVVECQRIPGGGMEVVAFDNYEDNAPTIEVGDDCSEAMARLDNRVDPDFGLRAATSGSSDKTVYTWLGCEPD